MPRCTKSIYGTVVIEEKLGSFHWSLCTYCQHSHFPSQTRHVSVAFHWWWLNVWPHVKKIQRRIQFFAKHFKIQNSVKETCRVLCPSTIQYINHLNIFNLTTSAFEESFFLGKTFSYWRIFPLDLSNHDNPALRHHFVPYKV